MTARKLRAHSNNLYGDVNLVSGVPWPVLEVVPGWHRFRLLNSGPVRPYHLLLIDEATGQQVSGDICWVVGGDGGYRATGPVRFPKRGMFVGVAERMDVVCDFSGMPGKKLILWVSGWGIKD